jgi:valyl-tRNA synthetase
LDVIEKFGADALRFGIAHLTTDTQDVRMPVQFECPHCESLIDQTRKNRELPRVRCPKCDRDFSTQWATQPEDRDLPRGAVVSERFELARNFCNKLWNVSRLALINLDGYSPGAVADTELEFEDRWILSRLTTVTRQVTEALDGYHYAEAARTLYDFAWDEFCSVYVEMVKPRLAGASTRPVAQRLLAHVLDTLLRLLHPMTPFLTEAVWELLGRIAPVRGLHEPTQPAESLVVASWPQVCADHYDEQLEREFSQFMAVLGPIREIRSRQGIPPRDRVEFCVQCAPAMAQLLQPMETHFEQLATATCVGLGPDVTPPPTHAKIALSGIEIFVDLSGYIDVEAEIARNQKQAEKLVGMIAGKEKKLANENFVRRAPFKVVQRERDSLAELQQQLQSVRQALENLKDSS